MNNSVQVLLVDDDAVDREAIVRAFDEARITNPIIMAGDGIEALAILRGSPARVALQRPYMILLDLSMPRMNGIEFLRELRDDPQLADSLVFVLSTSNSDEDKVAAYGFNVAGYVTKAKAAEDFSLLARLLEVYWRLIELPA